MHVIELNIYHPLIQSIIDPYGTGDTYAFSSLLLDSDTLNPKLSKFQNKLEQAETRNRIKALRTFIENNIKRIDKWTRIKRQQKSLSICVAMEGERRMALMHIELVKAADNLMLALDYDETVNKKRANIVVKLGVAEKLKDIVSINESVVYIEDDEITQAISGEYRVA
jgi:hypothetical protein